MKEWNLRIESLYHFLQEIASCQVQGKCRHYHSTACPIEEETDGNQPHMDKVQTVGADH